ncbi:MAG: hypothetical protein HY542_02755 [Deltaproteobacteria bacterium]|nr:hypothetical protein [Deltaproteobacteria bacterium]
MMKTGVLLILVLVAASLQAASVLPLEFKKIVQEAGVIFTGRCVGSSHELDENNFPVYWIQYRVEQGIKGVRDLETFWVKQFDLGAAILCPKDLEQVLFFYPESKAGFTSSVGLGQGRFAVELLPSGEKRVTSRYPHLVSPIGGIDLDSFISETRRWITP